MAAGNETRYMANHYVDNDTLRTAIIAFQATPPDTPIPDDLAIMVQLIATNLGAKRNWRHFRDLDDMVSAGLLAGLECLRKFDPTKSSSAFNYVTTVVQNGMIAWRAAETRNDYVEALHLRDALPSSSDLYEPSVSLIEREQQKMEVRRQRDRETRAARKARNVA